MVRGLNFLVLPLFQDTLNSTILGNEVLAVEMGASITNLSDPISITFRNMKYVSFKNKKCTISSRIICFCMFLCGCLPFNTMFLVLFCHFVHRMEFHPVTRGMVKVFSQF